MSTHKTTLEFTKDDFLTKNGDCILGISSDFELEQIKKFIQGKKKARMKMTLDGISEEVTFEINHGFRSNHEIVIRKTNFISERTLGLYADKSSSELNHQFKQKLKEDIKIDIEIIDV